MRMRPFVLAAFVVATTLAAALAADPKPNPAPAKPAAKTAPAPAPLIAGKVSGADGKPLSGASVRAIPMPQRSSGGVLRGGGVPDVPKATVAKTDAAGAFKLEGLSGGPFALRADAIGWAPAYAPGVPLGATVDLRLKPGLPVVGRVLDLTTQKPIAGATVTVLERDASRFGRDAAHTATTADNGTFRVADCAPGVAVISAVAPGKARAELDRVVVKPLPPGEEPKFDVNTLFLQPGGRLAGRVVGSDAKPIADVIVSASASDGNLMTMIREGRLAQRTDAAGKFAFDGIPAGNKYTLRATKEGFAADEDGPLTVEAGTDRGDLELKLENGATVTFRLVTADDVAVKDVDVRLQPQGGGRRRGLGFGGGDVDHDKIVPQGEGKFSVKALEPGLFDLTLSPPDFADITKDGLKLKSGETVDLGTLRVKESKSVSGRVTDASGQPVVGVSISALWFDGTNARSRETKSGAEGRYRISGLTDEPLRNLWARADGYATASREGAVPGDTTVDFVLEKTGTIVGRVVVSGGGAPAAFRVQTSPEAKEGQERPGFRVMIRNRPDDDKVFTDPSGNFRLDDVDPGTVTLTVLADGKAPARKAGLKVLAEQVVDVGTLTLEDGRTLRGRVVAAKDEAPIAGATVTMSQPQGFGRMMAGGDQSAGAAITLLDGRFEIAGLEARTYAIDAGQPEYSPNSGRVEIPSDRDPDEFVIHLSKGGTITGLVRDAAKQPIPNAMVLLVSPGRGAGPQTASAGVDGRYSFEKISPGDYTVIRAPTGGGPLMIFGGMKQVTVREGETTEFDLDEASKINLSGRVLKGGQPVANAIMFFTTPDAGGEAADMRQARTDADGHYQVGLDKAGTYGVVVSSGGGIFSGNHSTVPVEVPDQPAPVVDVTLKAAAITGHVTNAEGKPVSGAMVSATMAGSGSDRPHSSQDMTEPDGTFSIGEVVPGTYKLVVAAGGYRNAEVPSVVVTNENDSPSVDVRLEPGRTARGRVVDASGNGIAGASVMAAPSGTLPSGRDALPATSDVNGGFVLTVPADGPIDVTAVAAGFPPARLNGVVPQDGSDLLLRAPRAAQLRVSVLNTDGSVATGGAKIACRPVPAYLGSDYLMFLNPPATADPQGVAVVGSLAPGSYEVVVTLNSHRTTRSVSLAEGAEGAETVILP